MEIEVGDTVMIRLPGRQMGMGDDYHYAAEFLVKWIEVDGRVGAVMIDEDLLVEINRRRAKQDHPPVPGTVTLKDGVPVLHSPRKRKS